MKKEKPSQHFLKVGILKNSVKTNIHSIRQGTIPKGQCILWDYVSPSTVKVQADDGRIGTCLVENISL